LIKNAHGMKQDIGSRFRIRFIAIGKAIIGISIGSRLRSTVRLPGRITGENVQRIDLAIWQTGEQAAAGENGNRTH
jgi:hypothetical protein